jgi:hypothetical protein
MCSSSLESISLPVEVSGWDTQGSFFVEHSTLDCTEGGSKVLALRRSVSGQSFLFLRTLYSGFVAKSYPEAYRVESIESKEGSGFKYLHITNFLPLRSRECEPKDLPKHLIDVSEEVKS